MWDNYRELGFGLESVNGMSGMLLTPGEISIPLVRDPNPNPSELPSPSSPPLLGPVLLPGAWNPTWGRIWLLNLSQANP